MSELQRIPLNGGSAVLRRKKENLDDELDAVEKDISAVRMKMRRLNLL